MKKVIEFLKKENIGKYKENVSLSLLTTYKVGGNAKLVVYPKDTNKLLKLLKYIEENKLKKKVLGNGSNTLFSDKEFEGIIIKLDGFNKIIFKDTSVIVGAGYQLIKLANQTFNKGLSGLEFAAGIPGTVGGAIYMNAGAYKSDMGYVTKNIKVLTNDFKIITLTNSELDFHYRKSFLQKNKNLICLEATLKLKKVPKDVIMNIVSERRDKRFSTQPLDYPSAGSVFRNPEGMFAGKLIEDAGLKGKQIGGAMISEKHANFVINKKHASANDIKNLIELARAEVLKKHNIELVIEQEFVNWE